MLNGGIFLTLICVDRQLKKNELLYLLSFLSPQQDSFPLVCKYWNNIGKEISSDVTQVAPMKWYAHLSKQDILNMRQEVKSNQAQIERLHSQDSQHHVHGSIGSEGGKTDMVTTTKLSESGEVGKQLNIVSDDSASSSGSVVGEAATKSKSTNKTKSKPKPKPSKAQENDGEGVVVKTASRDTVTHQQAAKHRVVQVSLDNLPTITADPDAILRKTTIFSPGVNRKVSPNDLPISPAQELPQQRESSSQQPQESSNKSPQKVKSGKVKSKKADAKRNKEDQLLQDVKDIRSEQQLIALLEYIAAGYTKIDNLQIEKRRVKKLIKAWNATFLKNHGRVPSSEDRKGHLRELHEEYQQVRSF